MIALLPILGTVFFVAVTGNDTNSGATIDTPIQHIQSALDRATYGDTICVAPGDDYDHVMLMREWPNGNIGSQDHPITIVGYGYPPPTIRGDTTGIPPFYAPLVDFIRLINLRFCGSGNDLDSQYGGSGVSLGRWCWVENCLIERMKFQGLSCWNSTVTNCTIINNGGKGLENAGTNAIIANCVIGGNNTRRFSEDGQAAGVKLITRFYNAPPDVSGGKVINCLFVTNSADGFWADSVYATPDRPFIVANNIFSNNSGGIFIEATSGFVLINNLVDGSTNKSIVSSGSHSNVFAWNTAIVRKWASPYTAVLDLRGAGVGNRILTNRFSTDIKRFLIATGQDGPTPDSLFFDNVYAGNVCTNKSIRPQFSVDGVTYGTAADFSTAANGPRVLFGNRASNPNSGNK